MDTYLVTGGAGFIGSHIVDRLLTEGHKVRVLDNFDTGSRENLNEISAKVELLEGNIEDRDTATAAVKGVQYVFHEAARGSVPRSVMDPSGTHQANVTGTLSILEAARQAGVRRVVCASSSSVYGESAVLPKVEDMIPEPRSPYALSKLMLEHYCKLYSQLFGLETVALRYFNVYGPRQNPDLQYAAVVPIFIKNMLRRKQCTIYGDGEQTRDFTFVEDCVEANLLACKREGVAGQVYNVACGSQISVNELFRKLSEMLDYKSSPIYEDPRPGDVKHSYAGTEKIKSGLKFQPQFSLEQGLRQTIDWYRKQAT